eukprot:SAG31_NODE_36120_length_316_cov_0.935484_1_plen_58_part_01
MRQISERAGDAFDDLQQQLLDGHAGPAAGDDLPLPPGPATPFADGVDRIWPSKGGMPA